MSLFAEIKRRNVVKVGVAYLVVAWALAQAAGLLLPAFAAPPWIFRVIVLLLAIAFVIALVVAWVYELTPEGLKRTEEVPEAQSMSHITGQKLNFVIIGALALALIFVVVDSYVLTGAALPTAVAASSDAAASDSVAVPALPAAPAVRSALPNSVAVLPFANMSPSDGQRVFRGRHPRGSAQLPREGERAQRDRAHVDDAVRGYAAHDARDRRRAQRRDDHGGQRPLRG